MAGFQEIKEEIKMAVQVLNQGGTILYPSDTIWGLGCDATQDSAVQKILDIKKRPLEKGFIVLISNMNDLDRYVKEVPALAYELIEYAENPLTLVLQNGQKISPLALNENGSLGIRLVKSGYCFELLKAFKKPLISTSANFSGELNPKLFSEISSELKTQVDLICQSQENAPVRTKPSTIIKLDVNGTFQILRP